ncbi:methylenetetrahydrofolate reductase [Kineococcus gynurae]|uniref:Methylenetetrahydrofolate reductase n=1 Tax=Kineococcus gynurae TaxID=452979 RepID=A0ABV5LWQ6_9ACTN
MTLAARVGGPRPTISFELFPPRSQAAAEALGRTVSELAATSPDFFSVTCRAGGATRAAAAGLLRHVRRSTPVTAMAHLTCVGSSRAQVVAAGAEILESGIRDVLVLRGDPAGAPLGEPSDPVLRGCDLVEVLQVVERRRLALRGGSRPVDEGPLSIAVPAFPSSRRPGDLAALRAKQEAGARFAVAQVGYRAEEWTAFVDRARLAGVTIPVLPGITAVDDPARLLRLQQLTGVPAPAGLLARLGDDPSPARRRRLAVRVAAELARELLDAGAPGLHVYPSNSSATAVALVERIRSGSARLAGVR